MTKFAEWSQANKHLFAIAFLVVLIYSIYQHAELMIAPVLLMLGVSTALLYMQKARVQKARSLVSARLVNLHASTKRLCGLATGHLNKGVILGSGGDIQEAIKEYLALPILPSGLCSELPLECLIELDSISASCRQLFEFIEFLMEKDNVESTNDGLVHWCNEVLASIDRWDNWSSYPT